jgi:hypothetical protein
MLRKILAVIAGYAVFAVSSALLFIITKHEPHGDASIAFKAVTIAYGLFFSIISGLILQLVAMQKNVTLNFILAGVIFLLATVSLFTSSGSHWTQLFAMFIFAPASILGGRLKK